VGKITIWNVRKGESEKGEAKGANTSPLASCITMRNESEKEEEVVVQKAAVNCEQFFILEYFLAFSDSDRAVYTARVSGENTASYSMLNVLYRLSVKRMVRKRDEKVEQGLDSNAASTIPLHGSVEFVVAFQEQGRQGHPK
jgi:hypothetical protein